MAGPDGTRELPYMEQFRESRFLPYLVDHRGQPLRKEVLTQSIGGPMLGSVRSIATGHPASGLTPQRLAAILRQAEMGDAIAYLELAEQMEELDPHYRSVLGTRKFAVTQLKFTVEAADDTADAQADAQLLEDWLKRDALEEELFDILDAIGKGLSITEIVWETSAKSWMPKTLEWRDPRWWIMDRIDGVTPLLRDNAGFLPMDPYKWIYHRSKTKSGLPIRGGLARSFAWYWMFKNFSVKDWVAFAEVFGMPLRLGRYEVGETEENIRLLAQAVSNMGSDAAAVIAKSMEIEFVDSQKGASAAPGGLYESLANYCDTQASKLVLGQTATTDAIAGGHAVGKTHNEVRGDLKRADKAQLQATLNRDLAIPIVFLNRGVPKSGVYPRFLIDEEDDPLEVGAMGNVLTQLIPFGLRVRVAEVRQRLGFADPDPEDEVLAPPTAQGGEDGDDQEDDPKAQQITPGQEAQGAGEDDQTSAASAAGKGQVAPSPRRTLRTALSALSKPLTAAFKGRPKAASSVKVERDAIDAGIDQALSDWKPLADGLVMPIEELLAKCSSIEEARDRLIEALDKMDVDQVGELIAQTNFAARLAGMTDQDLS